MRIRRERRAQEQPTGARPYGAPAADAEADTTRGMDGRTEGYAAEDPAVAGRGERYAADDTAVAGGERSAAEHPAVAGRGERYAAEDAEMAGRHRGAGRHTPRGTMAIPRSRGAASGLTVMLLGIWGALIPLVGPLFHYAFINYSGFHFTAGRVWLEILPGAVAFLAGFELMRSGNRPTAAMAAMFGAAAGTWFVVGPTVSMLWNHGVAQTGRPLGGTFLRTIEWLGYFYAVGAAILFLSALALGRVTTKSVRDVRYAEERALAREAERV